MIIDRINIMDAEPTFFPRRPKRINKDDGSGGEQKKQSKTKIKKHNAAFRKLQPNPAEM